VLGIGSSSVLIPLPVQVRAGAVGFDLALEGGLAGHPDFGFADYAGLPVGEFRVGDADAAVFVDGGVDSPVDEPNPSGGENKRPAGVRLPAGLAGRGVAGR